MKKRTYIIAIIFICLVAVITFILIYKNKTKQDTFPYLLGDECEIIESDVTKGMTIKDKYGNEWVWICVPKTIVFKNAKDNNDYKNIELDIKEYVKDYSSEEYADTEEYEELKQKVLSSIYTYGGFWISRYEIGTENSRNKIDDNLPEAFSKQNLYVYNYVTFDEAQELAKYISNSSYSSNLLFGFQWDLVCKFIETNGYTIDNEKINAEMVYSNSSSWGNYYTSSFIVNRGKYSENYGQDYQDVTENFVKKEYKNILLTTGASEQNKVCNIYDFAGNVSEWTLEKSNIEEEQSEKWNTIRDGNFYFNYGGNDPVSGRYTIDSKSSGSNYGFRVSVTN